MPRRPAPRSDAEGRDETAPPTAESQPQVPARTNSSTGSGSIGSASSLPTDIRAPLWNHVTVLDRTKMGGGNVPWKCNYCPMSKSTSYTRVEAHLLQLKNKGISICPKVTYQMLSEMRAEVQRCKELLAKSREHTVSLPTQPAPSLSKDASKKNKRPASQLEKAWAIQDRKHLDALIARSFYSGGLSFNFARNPYIREAFAFACSRNLDGYVMPGYNRIREPLLKQERAHIESLMNATKSTWQQKGVTICADGWSDPQRRPLINFVAISEKSPVFLRADNCEGEIKTKEYIAEKLKSIIDEVGRHNVVQIITDNAANYPYRPDTDTRIRIGAA